MDLAIASYWILSGVTLVAVLLGFFVDKKCSGRGKGATEAQQASREAQEEAEPLVAAEAGVPPSEEGSPRTEEENKKEKQAVVEWVLSSGVGFKRLFRTSSTSTASVIMSALGVFFVELLQEGMELSLERDGYNLHHIIKFSASVPIR